MQLSGLEKGVTAKDLMSNGNHQTLVIEPGLAGLTQEQLDVARDEASKQRVSLCESVLRLGLVPEKELLTAAAEKSGYDFMSQLPSSDIEAEALEAVAGGRVLLKGVAAAE